MTVFLTEKNPKSRNTSGKTRNTPETSRKDVSWLELLHKLQVRLRDVQSGGYDICLEKPMLMFVLKIP